MKKRGSRSKRRGMSMRVCAPTCTFFCTVGTTGRTSVLHRHGAGLGPLGRGWPGGTVFPPWCRGGRDTWPITRPCGVCIVVISARLEIFSCSRSQTDRCRGQPPTWSSTKTKFKRSLGRCKCRGRLYDGKNPSARSRDDAMCVLHSACTGKQ